MKETHLAQKSCGTPFLWHKDYTKAHVVAYGLNRQNSISGQNIHSGFLWQCLAGAHNEQMNGCVCINVVNLWTCYVLVDTLTGYWHIDVERCSNCAVNVALQLQMSTRGQMLIVKAGEKVNLECEFTSESFSLFDNPVVWRKTQRLEQSQINMMGNLMEPFASERRFRATYQPYSPRYVFGLTIESKYFIDWRKL